MYVRVRGNRKRRKEAIFSRLLLWFVSYYPCVEKERMLVVLKLL